MHICNSHHCQLSWLLLKLIKIYDVSKTIRNVWGMDITVIIIQWYCFTPFMGLIKTSETLETKCLDSVMMQKEVKLYIHFHSHNSFSTMTKICTKQT